MAVSGSQKTRIGASISGMGKKLSIAPKDAAGVTWLAAWAIRQPKHIGTGVI